MRATTLLNPVVAAEKRLISVPRRVLPAARPRFEIDREDLVRSVEIDEGEILDDLLYPASRDRLGR